MPFTLAHPAAVIPIFKKYQKYFLLSALVVGSMSPDFEYFLRLKLVTRWSHSPLGIFTFNLPISLIVLWIFHHLQKEAVVSLLPFFIGRHLYPFCIRFEFIPVKRFLIICLSIIIGASTHLIWDGFTHHNGFLVKWVKVLNLTVLSTEYYQLKLYELFQDLSTFLGFLLLGGWIWRFTLNNATSPHPKHTHYSIRYKSRVIVCIIFVTVLLIVIISIGMRDSIRIESIRDIVRHIVVVAIPSAYLTITLYGIVYKFTRKGTCKPANPQN